MEVGHNVYISNRYNWYPGTVIKITATGMIDVQLTCGQNPIYRFNKDGWERGKRYDGYSIDKELPFSDRTLWLDQKARRRNVAYKIKDISGKCLYSGFADSVADKQALQDEVSRLQDLLDDVANLLLEVE